MSFRVRWTKTARNQLAEVWLSHPDRAGVTNAAHRIDTLLANDPENEGEDRPNNRRVLFLAPLIALYHVNTARNVVTVVGVGQYGTSWRARRLESLGGLHMTVIRLDAATLAQIKAAPGDVVLADEGGNSVRLRVLPPAPGREPDLTDEEWKRRMDPTNGMTTAQMLAYLKSLGTP
jgi:hypothetical protein